MLLLTLPLPLLLPLPEEPSPWVFWFFCRRLCMRKEGRAVKQSENKYLTWHTCHSEQYLLCGQRHSDRGSVMEDHHRLRAGMLGDPLGHTLALLGVSSLSSGRSGVVRRVQKFQIRASIPIWTFPHHVDRHTGIHPIVLQNVFHSLCAGALRQMRVLELRSEDGSDTLGQLCDGGAESM